MQKVSTRATLGWLFGLALAGCGGPSGGGPESSDASTLSDTSNSPGDERVADAPLATDGMRSPTDAGATSALTALAACLGTSKPLTLSGQMPYLAVPVGTESGEFVLDFGSTFSSIDLSAFAPPGPMTSGCDPSMLGETCTVSGFAFFSPPGSVELTTESFTGLGGTVTQAGIAGTDLLSEHVITLAYTAGLVFASPSASFCSDAALEAAGFLPLGTSGLYENDLSLLEPETNVDSNAPSDFTVPNVPTVSVRIGTANAIAQLDTGFDDDVTPFSVNINEAFYAAIEAASPSALVRDASLDTTLTTCIEGTSESVTGYRLATPSTFDFIADGGVVARSYGNAAIFVKDTPPAAQTCGGIGTWTVPAAQVAASYFNDMHVLVMDPYGARVWIPTQ